MKKFGFNIFLKSHEFGFDQFFKCFFTFSFAYSWLERIQDVSNRIWPVVFCKVTFNGNFYPFWIPWFLFFGLTFRLGNFSECLVSLARSIYCYSIVFLLFFIHWSFLYLLLFFLFGLLFPFCFFLWLPIFITTKRSFTSL